jgi:thiamine biosynthesis lipoprotein
MARTAGTHILPDDAAPMFDLYRTLYTLTDGKMTPLIGQALVDIGYDASYSLKPKEYIASTPKWDDVMEYISPKKLITYTPVQLDMGAIGKGYCIDIVSDVLIQHSISEFTVEAGGDIRHHTHHTNTKNSITVALEDPQDKTQAIGVASIQNVSICGSSGNRRAWREYHHILDPDTISSPKHILGLWVVADTAMVADALATALFFTKPETLKNEFHFEYLIIYNDRTTIRSESFPAELFT